MSLRGSVDSLDVEGASGWIFDTDGGRTVVVQAMLDGRVIGEAPAELPRPDLAAAGLGDGRCGFRIAFYDAVDAALLPFVAVRPQGGDVELPRTNLTGFGEYFRALHARFPGAGRHRSVFGGLWTDRTDAPRLLAGRVASGATPADLAPALRALIGEGYVVLKSALAPTGFAAAELALVESLEAGRPLDPRGEHAARRLLEALPGVVFRDVALRALRAILDDNPVIYRATLSRGNGGSFVQPSTVEALPSPAECVAMVACGGPEPALLDLVRGSHQLPEFTSDGRSRWLVAGSGAGVEIATSHALSVEHVEVGPLDLVLIGPGTLHRLRTPEGTTGVTACCAPSRLSPVRFIAGEAGNFTVRHHSGAILAV
jgi:hypothetical protein